MRERAALLWGCTFILLLSRCIFCHGYVVHSCNATTDATGGKTVSTEDCSCFSSDSTNPCPQNYYCPIYSNHTLSEHRATLDSSNCSVSLRRSGAIDVQCPCPPGFYCPTNTEQLRYCCAGYYCPSNNFNSEASVNGQGAWGAQMIVCPEGHFCPIGSIEPLPCDPLEICDAGTGKPDRRNFVAVLIVVLVLLFVGFVLLGVYRSYVKEIQDKAMNTHDGHEQDGNEERSGSMEEKKIEFKNITFVLPDGRQIMNRVSGTFVPGRVCAIMGPSGAGKTTIINLVCGKVLRSGGQVLVQGNEVKDLGNFKDDIGFVPQEDIMIRDLTVRDNISFSANYRLPANLTASEVEEKINACVMDLGISHVQHSPIGDEMTRGISGGQRKRVNIGIELVAEPRILFLDEPTSGLDSTSSVALCQILKRVAKARRMTVASVIHQPSMSAFHEFEDLLLLGKGGMVIYHGPIEDAPKYFATIGFPVPDKCNPADWYLDVSQGAAPRIDHPEFVKDDLFDLWEANLKASPHPDLTGRIESPVAVNLAMSEVDIRSSISFQARTERFSIAASASIQLQMMEGHNVSSYWSLLINNVTVIQNDLWCRIVDKSANMSASIVAEWKQMLAPASASKYARPGNLWQFVICSRRAAKQVFSNFYTFMAEMLIHLGIGFVVSNSAARLEYMGPYPPPICAVTPSVFASNCELPQIDLYTATGQFLCFGTTFAGVITGASTFGYEQVNYFRECSAGLNSIPYFWAKVLVNTPKVVMAGLLFYLPFSVNMLNNASGADIMNVILGTYFFAFAVGYGVSQVVEIKKVPLVAVFFAVVFLIIWSGVAAVKLSNAETKAQKNFFKLSGNRWTIEAFYKSQVGPLKTVHSGKYEGEPYINTASGMDDLGYGDETYDDCMNWLWGLSVLYTFIAMCLMLCANRSKKK